MNMLNNKPNKAKCRLCGDIIESFHQYDYVVCSCGEIAVDGGREGMRCIAKNWENFIRVDADGKQYEIILKSEEAPKGQQETQTEPQPEQALGTPQQKENALILLYEMIKNYESLPHVAMHAPASNADILSVLYLVGALFKESGSIDE